MGIFICIPSTILLNRFSVSVLHLPVPNLSNSCLGQPQSGKNSLKFRVWFPFIRGWRIAFILFIVGLCPACASRQVTLQPGAHETPSVSEADPQSSNRTPARRSLAEQQLPTNQHPGGAVGWENKPESRNQTGLGSNPTSLSLIWDNKPVSLS